MEQNYYMLHCGEDGISIRQYQSRDALLKELSRMQQEEISFQFLQALPKMDKGYWYGVPENAYLVIEGRIIVPKPKIVVQTYEIA